MRSELDEEKEKVRELSKTNLSLQSKLRNLQQSGESAKASASNQEQETDMILEATETNSAYSQDRSNDQTLPLKRGRDSFSPGPLGTELEDNDYSSGRRQTISKVAFPEDSSFPTNDDISSDGESDNAPSTEYPNQPPNDLTEMVDQPSAEDSSFQTNNDFSFDGESVNAKSTVDLNQPPSDSTNMVYKLDSFIIVSNNTWKEVIELGSCPCCVGVLEDKSGLNLLGNLSWLSDAQQSSLREHEKAYGCFFWSPRTTFQEKFESDAKTRNVRPLRYAFFSIRYHVFPMKKAPESLTTNLFTLADAANKEVFLDKLS